MRYRLLVWKARIAWALFGRLKRGWSMWTWVAPSRITWNGAELLTNVDHQYFQIYDDERKEGAPYTFGPALYPNKWGRITLLKENLGVYRI